MKIPNILRTALACLAIAMGLQLASGRAEDATRPFRTDDRWSIVGDSITHNGTWHTLVKAFYLTRYPALNLQAFNAGIAGDKTSGTLRRYEWDIKGANPTIATVMLGMNDVDRELYNKAPDPAVEKQRADSIAKYEANMTRLVDQLQADGVRVILITPSIFDETAELSTAKQTGTNGALGKCADFLRSLARKRNLKIVDFHGPMSQLNLERQKLEPKFTLIGNDRVHPGPGGHLVMAYLFIKTFQPSPVVSLTAINASTPSVSETVNVKVDDIRKTDKGLSFSSLEGALPFPMDPEASEALEWLPAIRDLNQQTLQVINLEPGNYDLSIDGTLIKTYSEGELAKGVNLAWEPNTPQNIQAQHVLSLIKQYRTLENQRLRSVAQTEHILLKDLPRPIDLSAAAPIIENRIQELKSGNAPRAEYYTQLFQRYLKIKPLVQDTQTRLAEISKEISAAAQPVRHQFSLSKSHSP